MRPAALMLFLATLPLGASDWSDDRNWRLNEQALERGVEIKRIFIYETWTDELEALATRQHKSGVRVLRVARNLLPASLQLNFVIWDGVCCFEPQHGPAGEYISQRFTFAAHDVAFMLDRFKAIESAAEPWIGHSVP